MMTFSCTCSKQQCNKQLREGGRQTRDTAPHWPWIVYFSRITSGLKSWIQKQKGQQAGERRSDHSLKDSPPIAKPGRCLYERIKATHQMSERVRTRETGSDKGGAGGGENAKETLTLVPVVPAPLNHLARVRLIRAERVSTVVIPQKKKGEEKRNTRDSPRPSRRPRRASIGHRRARQS